MAVEYARRAYPTNYCGIRFRSRLEATWAAFFDLLGWQWEYEPFDLGTWSPDFLIKGFDRDALVEIKPITRPDIDVVEKIANAADFKYHLILCGLGPVDINGGDKSWLWSSCACAGRSGCWMPRPIVKLGRRYDLALGHGNDIRCFVTGVNDFKDICAGMFEDKDINGVWGKAKNKTQWRPA